MGCHPGDRPIEEKKKSTQCVYPRTKYSAAACKAGTTKKERRRLKEKKHWTDQSKKTAKSPCTSTRVRRCPHLHIPVQLYIHKPAQERMSASS